MSSGGREGTIVALDEQSELPVAIESLEVDQAEESVMCVSTQATSTLVAASNSAAEQPQYPSSGTYPGYPYPPAGYPYPMQPPQGPGQAGSPSQNLWPPQYGWYPPGYYYPPYQSQQLSQNSNTPTNMQQPPIGYPPHPGTYPYPPYPGAWPPPSSQPTGAGASQPAIAGEALKKTRKPSPSHKRKKKRKRKAAALAQASVEVPDSSQVTIVCPGPETCRQEEEEKMKASSQAKDKEPELEPEQEKEQVDQAEVGNEKTLPEAQAAESQESKAPVELQPASSLKKTCEGEPELQASQDEPLQKDQGQTQASSKEALPRPEPEQLPSPAKIEIKDEKKVPKTESKDYQRSKVITHPATKPSAKPPSLGNKRPLSKPAPEDMIRADATEEDLKKGAIRMTRYTDDISGRLCKPSKKFSIKSKVLLASNKDGSKFEFNQNKIMKWTVVQNSEVQINRIRKLPDLSVVPNPEEEKKMKRRRRAGSEAHVDKATPEGRGSEEEGETGGSGEACSQQEPREHQRSCDEEDLGGPSELEVTNEPHPPSPPSGQEKPLDSDPSRKEDHPKTEDSTEATVGQSPSSEAPPSQPRQDPPPSHWSQAEIPPPPSEANLKPIQKRKRKRIYKKCEQGETKRKKPIKKSKSELKRQVHVKVKVKETPDVLELSQTLLPHVTRTVRIEDKQESNAQTSNSGCPASDARQEGTTREGAPEKHGQTSRPQACGEKEHQSPGSESTEGDKQEHEQLPATAVEKQNQAEDRAEADTQDEDKEQSCPSDEAPKSLLQEEGLTDKTRSEENPDELEDNPAAPSASTSLNDLSSPRSPEEASLPAQEEVEENLDLGKELFDEFTLDIVNESDPRFEIAIDDDDFDEDIKPKAVKNEKEKGQVVLSKAERDEKKIVPQADSLQMEQEFLQENLASTDLPDLDELEDKMKKIQEVRRAEKVVSFFKCQQANKNISKHGQNALSSFDCRELGEFIRRRRKEYSLQKDLDKDKLDKLVEGLLSLKKTPEASESLKESFDEENQIKKYIIPFTLPVSVQCKLHMELFGKVPPHLLQLKQKHDFYEYLANQKEQKKQKEHHQFMQGQHRLNKVTPEAVEQAKPKKVRIMRGVRPEVVAQMQHQTSPGRSQSPDKDAQANQPDVQSSASSRAPMQQAVNQPLGQMALKPQPRRKRRSPLPPETSQKAMSAKAAQAIALDDEEDQSQQQSRQRRESPPVSLQSLFMNKDHVQPNQNSKPWQRWTDGSTGHLKPPDNGERKKYIPPWIRYGSGDDHLLNPMEKLEKDLLRAQSKVEGKEICSTQMAHETSQPRVQPPPQADQNRELPTNAPPRDPDPPRDPPRDPFYQQSQDESRFPPRQGAYGSRYPDSSPLPWASRQNYGGNDGPRSFLSNYYQQPVRELPDLEDGQQRLGFARVNKWKPLNKQTNSRPEPQPVSINTWYSNIGSGQQPGALGSRSSAARASSSSSSSTPYSQRGRKRTWREWQEIKQQRLANIGYQGSMYTADGFGKK